jgi:TDG/mug DNA glycosylase family protein
MLLARGVGITNLVPFATARADELTRGQLLAGRDRLERFVATNRPRVVAVLGVTAYRTAFGRPRAVPGRQPEPIDSAELWVVPNPSGLNAHESVASLAAAYAEPARAAGIVLRLRRDRGAWSPARQFAVKVLNVELGRARHGYGRIRAAPRSREPSRRG